MIRCYIQRADVQSRLCSKLDAGHLSQKRQKIIIIIVVGGVWDQGGNIDAKSGLDGRDISDASCR